MYDQSPAFLWLMRAAFILLVLVILFFQLLPLDTAPRGWAGPDLLVAFAIAWSFRRPEFVPPVALAAAFFLADLLLQRPPGLWAALALMMCERLKYRARGLRDSSFSAEWIVVGVALAALTITYHFAQLMFLLTPPALTLSLIQMIATFVFYPAVVGLTHWLMRVRKVAPGDLDAFGQRA